jgi:hypothetical protein
LPLSFFSREYGEPTDLVWRMGSGRGGDAMDVEFGLLRLEEFIA